ncbi:palmitoyl-protein thioesterase [Marchantia polymorpha subsp. ruderalis]
MELLMGRRSARFGAVFAVSSLLLFFHVGSSFGQDVGALASSGLPFIVLHGIGDACRNEGLSMFTQLLMDMTGLPGYCIEIGNGVSDSFFMRLDKQADIVCEQVKSIKSLQDGYNMVGLSQGNVIGRAVIEFCDDAPPVNNFVSLGGPHAGIAAVPLCKILVLCKLVDAVIRIGVYSSYVQNNFAPTGYVKIPTDMEGYYQGCLFLPRLNNELPESRNHTYKNRFSSLNYLALIKFEQDAVLYPADTAWFGFYAPNDFSKVLPAEETDLYKEDWIGLKTLDRAGKVAYLALPGGHLSITEADMLEMVVPYLLPDFQPFTPFSTYR